MHLRIFRRLHADDFVSLVFSNIFVFVVFVAPCLPIKANALILIFMSIFGPSKYEIIVERINVFGQEEEIRGQCTYGDAYPYLIAVGALCFAKLIFAFSQAYQARTMSTEFAESKSIFQALNAMIMVLFVGGPVLGIAPENANAFAFVGSAITFVTCASMLLLMFIPKIIAHKKDQMMEKRPSRRRITRISGLDLSGYEQSEDLTGIKILTTKTPEQLLQEVEQLKGLLAAQGTNNNTSSNPPTDSSSSDKNKRITFNETAIIEPPVDAEMPEEEDDDDWEEDSSRWWGTTPFELSSQASSQGSNGDNNNGIEANRLESLREKRDIAKQQCIARRDQ